MASFFCKLSLIFPLLLMGCKGPVNLSSLEGSSSGAQISPLEKKYNSSDEDIRAGARSFKEGSFGKAQVHFKRAVESSPKDVRAWLGLAASYDRLRRFDLADQAYDEAAILRADTFVLANNRGYSYLLRGEIVKAKKEFLTAKAIKPHDKTINNNLEILLKSRRHIRR